MLRAEHSCGKFPNKTQEILRKILRKIPEKILRQAHKEAGAALSQSTPNNHWLVQSKGSPTQPHNQATNHAQAPSQAQETSMRKIPRSTIPNTIQPKQFKGKIHKHFQENYPDPSPYNTKASSTWVFIIPHGLVKGIATHHYTLTHIPTRRDTHYQGIQ
jgi:hypothetical protein